MSPDYSLPWCSHAIAVIDFETSSSDPETCEPVEVAIIRFEGGAPVARFSSLLKPANPIPQDAVDIHHITTEMCANAPTLEAVAGELAKVAKDAVPCAYNETFDRRVLHRFITGTDVPLFDPSQRWLDPFPAIAKQDKFQSGKKLTDACRRRGIIVGDAHRAEFDAIAAGKLLHVLMGEKKPSLGALLDRMALARVEHEVDRAQYLIGKWTESASLDDLRVALKLLTKINQEENAA